MKIWMNIQKKKKNEKNYSRIKNGDNSGKK